MSDDQFEEAAYLAAHPDVAAAVAKGGFASGAQHYEHYGKAEGRSLGFPALELEVLRNDITNRGEVLSFDVVAELYRSHGLKLLADPFDSGVSAAVACALEKRKPFSAVRIGDSEANLLTFGEYPDTPTLDSRTFEYCFRNKVDRVDMRGDAKHFIREAMLSSILQADIVGVLGLWWPKPRRPSDLIQEYGSHVTGLAGQWRGIDYMLRLAANGCLNGKLIAPAHFYFGIVSHISTIVKQAKRVLLISSRPTLAKRLETAFGLSNVGFIEVGKGQPDVLSEVENCLPRDMRGTLALIGAGPWAELYCSMVKRRGGVGVDVGSGLDLMEGNVIRPVHQMIRLDRVLL